MEEAGKPVEATAMSRGKVRRTCIKDNQAGRRGAGCRKMMGSEWQEGGRMDPGVVLVTWEPFIVREPLCRGRWE